MHIFSLRYPLPDPSVAWMTGTGKYTHEYHKKRRNITKVKVTQITMAIYITCHQEFSLLQTDFSNF